MTLMTQVEYARHIGKTKQYVSKLKRTGKITVDKDGLIDSDVADVALQSTADPARAMSSDGKEEASGGVAARNSYTEARTRREILKSNFEEMKMLRVAGELVEAAAVESVLTDVFRDLRERLMGLPTKVKGRLVSMVDEREIQGYLADEVQTILTDISDKARERVGDVRGRA